MTRLVLFGCLLGVWPLQAVRSASIEEQDVMPNGLSPREIFIVGGPGRLRDDGMSPGS